MNPPDAAGALARSALTLALSLALGCAALGAGNPKVPAGAKSSGGLHAVIETDKGPIEVALLANDSPMAVENFRLLAEHGCYDGSVFHRIVRGFMMQGGLPPDHNGISAWGGAFPDNINSNSLLYRRGYRRGTVAMANSGPNTNTCQFFIMQGSVALAPVYVIFGTVTKGMDVVDALGNTPTKAGGPFGGEKSTPIVPPVIRTITIQP
jgi:cyclophilin family peptidyl-prolyl cis-trans isomerase